MKDTIRLVYTKMNDFRRFLYSNNAVEGEGLYPNNWLTNTAYSTSTLRSNDLEKGWEKTTEPPFSGRLCLGVWHDQTGLNSITIFESSSPCSCDELGQVWLQTLVQEDV